MRITMSVVGFLLAMAVPSQFRDRDGDGSEPQHPRQPRRRHPCRVRRRPLCLLLRRVS